MIRQALLTFTLIISTIFTTMAQTTQVDLTPFGPAKSGYVQYVIDLPHSTTGQDYNKKVAFYVGKMAEVDLCNSHFLQGIIHSKELKGWGYTYYEFETDGMIMSTMKGCLDNMKELKFVASRSMTIDYNGRMPIVLYVPEGYEVRYKIYTASADEYAAKQVLPKK